MTELHIDFETRSAVDLRKTGVHVYAEDPTTDVWCAAYAFDGEEPSLWVPGDPVPEAVETADRFVAHNAAFEIAIWREILTKRYGWPPAPAGKWRCTMAQCYAMAMPGALDNAAVAFGLDYRKDDKGYRLMLSMAKPRRVEADGTIVWWDEEDRKQRLYRYCEQDVRVEMALDKRSYRLQPAERAMWVLDQEINNRGFVVDEKACIGAQEIVDRTRKRLNEEMKVASNYAVTSVNQVANTIDFLATQGVEVEALRKDIVEDLLLRDDLPPAARRVLELRQQGSKMSVSKVNALLNGKSRDGRARGTLQYHAAATGRWGGRRFQPQNLKRPDKETAKLIGPALNLLRDRQLGSFEIVFDDPIDMIGNCIRGLVKAPDGGSVGAADYSNIEGRVAAWLAGEDWKVDAFAAFDAGTGADLYKLAYAKSFSVPTEEVDGDQRQIGKVQELSMQYQGGPGAFENMAKNYGVDIGAEFDKIKAAAPLLMDEAYDAWATYGKSSGMAKRKWLAAEVVKRGWRNGHPAIVQFWTDIERAAVEAVERPGALVECGRLKFKVHNRILMMQLPSGKALFYPNPKIEWKDTPWGKQKKLLTFYGQDTYTRKWGRTSTYGGKLFENAVQAIARDLLRDALLRLDKHDVNVVLHVHDEVVFDSEIPVGDNYLAMVCSVMEELPTWAAGLPVKAEGWVGERYRK